MVLATNDELCSGCRVCEVICALVHFREMNPKKAAVRIEGFFPAPGTYKIHLCTQCGKCVEVCPSKAISTTSEGACLINQELCSNCGLCVDACPSGAIFRHASVPTPICCDLCGQCAEWCPREAIYRKGDAQNCR